MRRWGTYASALVMAASLAACTGTGMPDGAVARIGNGAEPQALDPHLVTGVPEHRITSALFEGLVDLDPVTLEPVPAVAESWTVSDDAREYTFTLRASAKWSNGDPVTAHDFAYAWRRILTPSLGAEYAYMLHCIKNARAFNEGDLDDFAQVGVRAVDDRTLRVTLEEPTPYFLAMQIFYAWYPVHKANIEAFGAMDERGTRWTRPGNLVGNGAFVLDRWQPNSILVVKKNPFYWNADAVKLDAVQFFPIDDALTEERSFRAGRLHLTESVPLNKTERYQKDHPELLHVDPYYGSYFYRLNVTKPPFDDVRVRRAFAMAVDRERLVDNVVKMGRKPAFCFTPPDAHGYTCESRIPYDPDKAKSLLAEAGYPGGEGLPPVELLYNTSENHKLIAEAVQQMWKQTLGVEVALLNQDWKVYLSSMSNLDYQIARSAWIADFVDPINFLECFMTGGGNNRTGWSSPEYDALIDKARRTIDPEARRAVFQEAEAVLLDEAPLIPMYFYTRVYLKAPELKGLAPNLLGYINFKHLHLESEQGQGTGP